jgi:triosephosphate isomerase
VIEVCRALGRAVADRRDARVLYGGSAGPGLLTELWPAVDGVFLGRFAHEVDALVSVVQEAAALQA